MEKKYVKKETEKIDLLQVKDLIHIIVKFRIKKHFQYSIIHQSSFWEGHRR